MRFILILSTTFIVTVVIFTLGYLVSNNASIFQKDKINNNQSIKEVDQREKLPDYNIIYNDHGFEPLHLKIKWDLNNTQTILIANHSSSEANIEFRPRGLSGNGSHTIPTNSFIVFPIPSYTSYEIENLGTGHVAIVDIYL